MWPNLIINDMYKLTNDGFVWEVISSSQVAECNHEVFILNDDDSETLVTDFENVDPSKVYGIEVDYVKDINTRAILTVLIIQEAYEEFENTYDVWPLVGEEIEALRKRVLDLLKYRHDNK